MDDPDPDDRVLSRVAGERRRPNRTGFSLPEVLAAIAIIAVLAALVVPVVADRLGVAHTDAVVSEMQNLENGLRMFYRDVGRYPRQLNYLVSLEDANGIRDACGAAISATQQAKYRGPYINKVLALIDPYGTPTPNTRYILSTDDSVDAVLTRTTYSTISGGTQQAIQILVYGPDEKLVEQIDTEVDGTISGTDGTIRYATPLDANDNIVHYTFPIRNGAC